ncbi:MAG: hypothetical protein R3E76_11475 [Planctomycetota bacterium]
MLVTRNSEPQIRIGRLELDGISRWLGGAMQRSAREQLGTFFVKLLGAMVVAGFLYGVMFFFAMRFFVRLGDEVLLLPLVPFGIGFVIQAFIHRKAHGVMHVNDELVRFADEHSFMARDDEDLATQIFRWALVPAWLFFSSFESLADAYRLSRTKPEPAAAILAHLAASDRRVSIPEIEHRFGNKQLVRTIRGLLAFPGVLVSSRDVPCLLLSKDLGDELRQML